MLYVSQDHSTKALRAKTTLRLDELRVDWVLSGGSDETAGKGGGRIVHAPCVMVTTKPIKVSFLRVASLHCLFSGRLS